MVSGMVLLPCLQAGAADASRLEERVSRLEQRVQEESNVLDGLNLGIGATMVVQGTRNANGSGLNAAQNSYKGDDATDASYSVDVEFEKEFVDTGSTAFLYLTTGEGWGVTDNLELYSNVNYDADNSANLSVGEIWWRQDIDGVAVMTAGKIDPAKYIDTNEYANDECSQFLGSMFRNSPVIEFSGNSFGARVGLPVTNRVDIETVVVDGDADFNQVGDSLWVGLQASIKPELLSRPGNYRLLYWYNDVPHTKWADVSKIKKSGRGFGVSIDQEIVDNIGIFGRAGRQADRSFIDSAADGITPEDFSLSAAYSLGLQAAGKLWGRENDAFGIGCGIIEASDEYKKATGRNAKTEGHLEMYYRYVCNEHVSISPDLQVISSPFGKDAPNGDSTIFVGGIRTQIDF